MNREELLKKQEKLQEEMDELKKLIKQAIYLAIRERKKYGETYWEIDVIGDVTELVETNSSSDLARWEIGNYYYSERQAEIISENKKTYQRLKDLASELNGNKKIDWDNFQQHKYNIYYDYSSERLLQNWQQRHKAQGAVYCLNGDFLDVALKEIGKAKLIQLIKEGI